ncbi:dihydrodipicolinate synthase family protein [Lacibacter sediminis]|uniref:Dihydrodipicolinate synthase family protein n=1 Tax=Lacibacter sediminis TaxID=2760713 RepID=A0A7G5XJP2_9BACT|nr:dihydrodipicolinate synthase family protein [Lacibacter sediminis]QNA45695.1 dihydrodipicolinate synthase family protein [Lacibacter sediminis]
MKKNKKFSGVIVPAVTPLTKALQIDDAAVGKLFDQFYKHNISPFILGTTGESASLPADVKEQYVKSAAKHKKAGTVLYAGISSNVVAESIEFAAFCADHAVDAVAATLPSYYALTETQMKNYFETLADASPLPVIIYNIPATTHMSIPLQLIDELSHHPNIIATKDSERSDERLVQSLALWKDREDFGHFLGWAAKSADALTGGSDGLIPSTGNLMPDIYDEMLKAVEAGDHAKAYDMQKLSDVYGNLYQSGKTLGESLWALKALMQQKGLCEDVVMPPLHSLSEEEKQRLIQSYEEIKR